VSCDFERGIWCSVQIVIPHAKVIIYYEILTKINLTTHIFQLTACVFHLSRSIDHNLSQKGLLVLRNRCNSFALAVR
jgi:hypothetical protein